MSVHESFRLIAAMAAAALLATSQASSATEVGGGGSSKLDCLATFDAAVNTPAKKPRNIRVEDGRPCPDASVCDDGVCDDGSTCDIDGVVNGECKFRVSVCANSTFNTNSCSLLGVRHITVEHAADNGDPKFDPQFQALQTRIDSDISPPNSMADQCTTATNLTVPIKGPVGVKCKKNKKTVRVVTESTVAAGQGTILIDKDKIDLTCDPPGTNDTPPQILCDAQQLFDSAYDRVQRQIFNQSCAVSGCHDSNSFMDSGNLLLESSAFPGNLIDRTPTNPSAVAEGWKRIIAGDPANSYIIHKLNGDFPDNTFGDRMPRNRPKLDQNLIDVITAWIQGGCPTGSNTWPPGTF